jgi:MoaA/NifB/PqqE/SkfB family radical SAM enzyme
MNLQFEITSHCQLACIECPHRLMKRKKQHMSDAVFGRVLEYICRIPDERKTKGYPPTIITHINGEPILHPRFQQYIKEISDAQPDYRFNIYTNGLKLTRGFIDFLESLPNETRLLISYHFYNGDGELNDYTEVNAILRECFVKKHKKLEFILTSHVNRFCSLEFLKKWQDDLNTKYAKAATVPVVAYNTHINPWTDLIHEENTVTFDGCPYMDFGHLFIGVTGNVIPCCMDLEEELVQGNIMEDSYNHIFSRMERFYERLQQKRNFEPLCLKCMKGSNFIKGVSNE